MIDLFKKINTPKNYLLLVNVFLVFFLIVLSNLKVIPLEMSDFVFFAVLFLALALWRPGWAFLIFCGIIPLENVNLAPVSLGIAIRPYQFAGALIVLSILARLASGRLNFKLAKLKLPDYAVALMALGGFFSLVTAPDKIASLKLEIIFLTFVMLYFLVRNYVQSIEDVKKIIPFVLSSSIVVALYGIWQNIIFLHGGNSFEVMPGRPNATFTEADWLGVFVALMIAVIYSLIFYFNKKRSESLGDAQIFNFQFSIFNKFSNSNDQIILSGFYIILTILYVALILTVSRAAWLGAFVSYVIFVLVFFTDLKFKHWRWKETSFLKLKIVSALVIAILAVYIFHLTNFQLGNRLQSTGSGEQKITVSCDQDDVLPESISEVSELEKYSCRHINLEEIEEEKAAGKIVTEVKRSDPNVNIRAEIYQKSWVQIKNHPISGIGWGSIGSILGRDGRGAILNSSNIFLETWLGAGILGIFGLLGILGYILFSAVKNYFYTKDNLQKALALFIIVSWFSLIVFNLFNAGMFLGFLWVWLAVAQAKN